MPMIKPVSELRNYPEVLKDVKAGQPVYLTKNGTGKYVLIDIEDYSEVEAAKRLGMELLLGRISGEKDGWLTKESVRAQLLEKSHV